MESGATAGAALMSPLAVDDVFRQQTVPEVQELLRQLQVQQANDAEEVRTLIGVRYLSFLEGLPEISRMQRAADEALKESKDFASTLKRLDTAVSDEEGGSIQGSKSLAAREEAEQSHLHQQTQQHQTPQQHNGFSICQPSLQNSTPLDDLLFARDGRRGASQPGAFRYVKQQLLVLPSRIWESVRQSQFLEALRIILIEAPAQAEEAEAAVRAMNQQQQQQQHSERHIKGCLAVAQQTLRAAQSLLASVRALALRHLATPDLPPCVACNAAAAVVLIYLLNKGAAAAAEAEVFAEAAKWLLGVFFSARVEALESQKELGGGGERAAEAESADQAEKGGARQRAVNVAERLIVAFASSVEAAAVLFAPSASDGVASGVSELCLPPGGDAPGVFAAVVAAEETFDSVDSSSKSGDAAWALKALPHVFAIYAAQPCGSTATATATAAAAGSTASRFCCDRDGLCPRARMFAFVEQWRQPLEKRLARLCVEAAPGTLIDLKAFWVTLMEKLETRGQQWHLATGASLFALGGASDNQLQAPPVFPRGALGVQLFGAATNPAHLLSALGEACAKACVSLSASHVRGLPLLTLQKGDSGAAQAPAGEFAVKAKPKGLGAFEKGLMVHLADVADLFGKQSDPEGQRAAVSLRAAVATSLLQALAECAAPLAKSAAAAAAASSAAAAADDDEGASPKVTAPDSALLRQARSVECLFLACRDIDTSGQAPNSICRAAGKARDALASSQEDPDESDAGYLAESGAQLGAFLAEWITAEAKGPQGMVAEAAAAARSLPSSICTYALLGYAAALWSFVKSAVKDLREAWRWQEKAAVVSSTTGRAASDISGGTMAFLLQLSRGLTLASQELKLCDLGAAPLLCFALKAITAEEVAAVARAALQEAAQPQQPLLSDLQSQPSPDTNLLQLLVDVEAVEAAHCGRHSEETLREITKQSRQGIPPSLVKTLEEVQGGDVQATPGGSTAVPSAAEEDKGNQQWRGSTPVPPLLAPRERLSLLPVAPLPAFAFVLIPPSSEKLKASDQQAPTSSAEENRDKQQAHEPVKQLHRLRLDDAVDSVSRGLQSWLKRGSADAEGPGLMEPVRAGASAASGAVKGAAASVAGSGLAEAWAKQMGHVSALIGQHVESVQSRATQSVSLNLGQKNGNAAAPHSSGLLESPQNGN